jgi:hypothetical protein
VVVVISRRLPLPHGLLNCVTFPLMTLQMRNDPVPISPAVATWLNQPRLVGQDVFGLLQGEGVFVDDGVVAGGLFVFGDPQ